MKERCILIFPQFHNGDKIDNLIKKYNGYENNMRYHITVVFPFVSDLSEEQLRKHIIKALSGTKSFEIKMEGITGTSFKFNDRTDYCLFLNVKQGNDKIIDIHDKLYTGILEPYLNRSVSYNPHITLSKLKSFEAYKQGVEETVRFKETFRTWVNKLSIQVIDENKNCKDEFEISLY